LFRLTDLPLSSLFVETSMKYVLPVCIILVFSITAYGQQAGADLRAATPNQPQPAAEQISQAMGDSTPVVVNLQICEVSLTKLRRLGLDPAKLFGDPNTKTKIDQTGGNTQQSQAIATFSGIDDGSEAQRFLETLRKDKLVKVLADPTLMTLSGKTAVSNSGSKLPVPKWRPDGSMAIEYQYGTEVEITPEVLGDTIRLAIHGRVSELDSGNMIHVGQQTVPGVRVREFCTRTELKSGQTLAISGLKQIRMEAVAHGVPYISEVPYLGAMFRIVKEEPNEIEIFILVRPEIVQSPATASH
jgi:pilus assembly protein CpaC